MRAVAFDALGTLDSTGSSYITPLPAVFTLRNVWVHIYSMNHCDKDSNIEVSVNQFSSIRITLDIPDIEPDNRYVRFRRDLDNSSNDFKIQLLLR